MVVDAAHHPAVGLASVSSSLSRCLLYVCSMPACRLFCVLLLVVVVVPSSRLTSVVAISAIQCRW
ncbi:hypothetical protein E2562_035652 [Oryza meyeriana var. granulata]|uniref:Uncharacterized protein n=1 Tax=Oryza meyeriana var. granulata TaxID=110450 RepID=A0A6G1FFG3_9ORYZ|nr:hypothetical protein E2562_035652 [Oryza meyeriana var. granulata]